MELCKEDQEVGEEKLCGKLVKAMYGTRTAARMWQREVTKTLTGPEFTAGRTPPCLFHHRARDVMSFVHGDDFVSSGTPEDLEWLRTVLAKKYCLKTTVIGEQTKFEKHVRELNRLVRWHSGIGVTVEADPRHVEILLKDTGAKHDKIFTVTVDRRNDNTDNKDNTDHADINHRIGFREGLTATWTQRR